VTPETAGHPPPAPPPAAVRDLAAGRELRLVWHNEYASTFDLGTGADRCFVKWSPASNPQDLDAEAARMTWAAPYSPVPKVLAQGADEAGSWLVTAALPGRNAVDDHWKARPDVAVRAIGEGLRSMHDALPVASCPFSWMAEDRLAHYAEAAEAGWEGPRDEWHDEYAHLTLPEALKLAAEIPPADQLVVCQGDACAPNTLLTDDGRWSGHVDLGCLGVADRWADLAVATWSTEWNYGPGWAQVLLDAYGVAGDEDRTWYYRLLWDLG
jgi:aminoglycoside phosphotransferase